MAPPGPYMPCAAMCARQRATLGAAQARSSLEERILVALAGSGRVAATMDMLHAALQL